MSTAEPLTKPSGTLENPQDPASGTATLLDKGKAPATADVVEAETIISPSSNMTSEKPALKPAAPPIPDADVSAPPLQQLWTLANRSGHSEVWSVTLADPDTHVPSQIVFQKYLNANDGNLDKAKEQLMNTLIWRHQKQPLELLKGQYDQAKFGSLGYVTTYGSKAVTEKPDLKEVFTWNIYGGVKNVDETFGNVEEFIAWRTALMEIALRELSISTATVPITATYDPHKITQVHDYKGITFFRQSPKVRAASTETIKVFAQNYPELLKEKFFINVPVIMGFMYGLMKLFVAPKTLKKFHPMSNGAGLAKEFGSSRVKSLGDMLPKEYGGKGEDLKSIGKEPATA